MKGLLLGAAALDAAGNLMYALAEVAASPYLLLAGRLTSGVAAGSGVLASVYVGTFHRRGVAQGTAGSSRCALFESA
jgi:hypothetical protein